MRGRSKRKVVDHSKPNSGKSKSGAYPNGRRRKSEGNELAPVSLRRKGKRLLSECTDTELQKAQVKREEEKV